MFAAIPTWLLGVLVVGGLVVAALVGLLATRPLLRPLSGSHNDLAGFIFAVVGVVYAVLLGLVAVAAASEVDRIEAIAVREAGAVVDLHRRLEGYPPAFRDRQQARLEAYAKTVVDTEWPAMRRDLPITPTSRPLGALGADMVTFAPLTPAAAALHPGALDTLDTLRDQRRARLLMAEQGIRPLTWAVLWLGVLLTIGFTYFFWADRLAVHMAMTATTSAAIALVLFLIMAMDHPLHGRFHVTPVAFEQAREAMGAQVSSP